MSHEELIARLPKVELHVHLEGTLEPEMAFELASRNGVALPHASAEEMRAAYRFTDLQSFLDIYYESCSVLRTEQDFYDLTRAYLDRAVADNVRHVEPFFDPQTHTTRGAAYHDIVSGIRRALDEARERDGITSKLIMCVLRDLSDDEAMTTLRTALLDEVPIDGIGLDSTEVGNPPSKFIAVFDLAGSMGLHRVAHAGEEGPASYIRDSIDLLGAERIDHGVRCGEDAGLVGRLMRDKTCLTVCPFSNVALQVVESLEDHPLREMLEVGLAVTVNSDDPAYFGGYIGDNYRAVTDALDLTEDHLAELAFNAIVGSFADDGRKTELLAELKKATD
ncbi:MAG TPA: adenosine deaminase [Coriobacteriia bacterium]